jgi:hypothetical protein
MLTGENSRSEQDDDAAVRACLMRSPATDVGFRERDTMDQRIGAMDEVIATVTELVQGTITWAHACQRLPPYDGVQAVAGEARDK